MCREGKEKGGGEGGMDRGKEEEGGGEEFELEGRKNFSPSGTGQ